MDALRQIVQTEGVWRPIRGVNVLAVGAGPAHALYFACYEKIKFSLSDAIYPGTNSHFANGKMFPSQQTLTYNQWCRSLIVFSFFFLYFKEQKNKETGNEFSRIWQKEVTLDSVTVYYCQFDCLID